MTDGACMEIQFESEMDSIAPQPMLSQNRRGGLGNPEKDGWRLAARSLLRNFGMAARRRLRVVRYTSAAKCKQKMANGKHKSCWGGQASWGRPNEIAMKSEWCSKRASKVSKNIAFLHSRLPKHWKNLAFSSFLHQTAFLGIARRPKTRDGGTQRICFLEF